MENSAKLDSSTVADAGIVSCVLLLLAKSIGEDDVTISCDDVTTCNIEDLNGSVDNGRDTNSLEDGKIVGKSAEEKYGAEVSSTSDLDDASIGTDVSRTDEEASEEGLGLIKEITESTSDDVELCCKLEDTGDDISSSDDVRIAMLDESSDRYRVPEYSLIQC